MTWTALRALTPEERQSAAMKMLQVKIGMRVKVRFNPGDDKQPPFPVFVPVGGAK